MPRNLNDRAAEIMELQLDYIPNPRFSRKGADNACLGEMPEAEKATRKAKMPSGLPPYLASLYEMPLLTREQEGHLFRKYNYLKYKASKLRDTLDPSNPKASTLDEIEALHDQIVSTKNEIARANLRLVVSLSNSHPSAKLEKQLVGKPIAGRVEAGSSLKFCRVAEGRADFYPRLGSISEWDIAAGHAIVRAAGGEVTRLNGSAMHYGNTAKDYRTPPFVAWGREILKEHVRFTPE